MRVAVLTSSRQGLASTCLPALAAAPGVEVVCVVHALAHFKNARTRLRRQVRKAWRIGPLGVLTGLALRPLYAGAAGEDVYAVAARLGIPVRASPRTNAPETSALLREAAPDLGLSLGNGYIARRVFSVPRHGMLNVHGEVLPEFQGAASVMWQIYEGRAETGFTIHQVDEHFDTGPILYVERFPLEFRASFADTVKVNNKEANRRIPVALAKVVSHYEQYRAQARTQSGGRLYTTPTFREYRRMLRQHRRLSRQ
jgi:methionyl-tRNA formyltransferase